MVISLTHLISSAQYSHRRMARIKHAYKLLSNSQQPVGLSQNRFDSYGMSLVEMLVALAMLVTFTGVVAMVMEFSLRFLGESESAQKGEMGFANGVLIDHQQIQSSMDRLVDILSQPGISKERLEGVERCPESTDPSLCVPCPTDSSQLCWKRIAHSIGSVNPKEVCPAFDPVSAWGLPMPSIALPPSYRLCLWSTTAVESPMKVLMDADDAAKPGIYFLQALPDRLNASTLPTRRLFCRPRPFCKSL